MKKFLPIVFFVLLGATFHFLGSRVEVNCYYDTSIDIGKDKKMFRNDVINLMEDTFRYIWGHIKINRTIREGGKTVGAGVVTKIVA